MRTRDVSLLARFLHAMGRYSFKMPSKNVLRPVLNLNALPIWRREVRVWGYRMTPPSLDRLVCLALHRAGLMGNSDKTLLSRWIRPGMVVVDVGANQGLYSLLFSELVGPSGEVFAFEPEPTMFRALVHNCKRNSAGNIRLFPFALGSNCGTATLSRSLLNSGDNRLAAGPREHFSAEAQVEIVTLDEVIGDHHIDFIKIDVQGWEFEVFRGMDRTLQANPAVQIYFEVWPQGLIDAGCQPAAPLQYLSDRGFDLSEDVDGELRPVKDYTTFGSGLKGYRFRNLFARRPGT